MASTLELLRKLSAQNVDYILVGGMAAIAHGASTVTEDVDICIKFDLATMERLLRALQDEHPRQRMNPARPPLGDDPKAYIDFKNLYLITDDGVLDLLGEIAAIGDFDKISPHTVEMDLGGFRCRVIGLEDLIACKRAIGRPKDVRVADELELVRSRVEKK